MDLAWKLIAAVITFGAMEGVSWAVHKYLLHGPLWFIHQTHHKPRPGQWWEANDLVSLFFALTAATALYLGIDRDLPWLAGFGAGITAYGMVYFLIHDIAAHGRISWRWLTRNKGIARLRRSHKLHHKYTDRQPGHSFGLLYVSSPPRKSHLSQKVGLDGQTPRG